MMRRILPLLALAVALWSGTPAHAQSAPKKYFSAATTNSTLVLGRNSLLKTGIVANTGAAVYYLKFYNKATAPVCGTDVPVWTVPIPFGTGVGNTILPVSDGLTFPLGIGFCITANFADADTTAVTTGVIVNLGVTGR